MVEWNTGMTLIVLAISFMKQFSGSAMALSLSVSSKFILDVCQSIEQTEPNSAEKGSS